MDTAADDTRHLPAAPDVFHMEVGLLQNLCTIVSCPETKEAAIVDPAWEVDRLLAETNKRGLRVTKVLITHTHNDHVEGVATVVEQTGAAVVIHGLEVERVKHLLGGQTAAIYELCGDRQDIAIGRRGVRALHTPGHTVGGTCFLGDGFLISGDVLFVGGCGRTDFTGGDTAQMWSSLQRIAGLPEETRIFPGHDYGTTPTSSIGRELLENPYLRCATFEDFRALRERKRPG
ncbi:MAG TPA: MBL fold metallo-hydrolase [Polyangia bacterium]|nr:MBL fold metallo-hydrolase [Polyangia bacterium]